MTLAPRHRSRRHRHRRPPAPDARTARPQPVRTGPRHRRHLPAGPEVRERPQPPLGRRLLRCALYLQCAPGDILGSTTGDQVAFADTFFATPGGLTLARLWRDLPPDRRDILIHLAAALKTSAAEPARSA